MAHTGLLYYLAKRLLLQVIVLLGLSLMTFVLTNLIPGDPVRMLLGPRSGDPQLVDMLKERWGLDRPLYERYFVYLWNLIHGDLGYSIHTNRAVTRDLLDYFPATFELATAALLVALVVGIPLGVICATRRNRAIDHIFRVAALLGVSMPVFWLGIMALLLFYVELGWTGPGRIGDMSAPSHITGLFVLDSILTGNLNAFFSSLQHLILPAMVLSAEPTAMLMRMTRSSMLEVLSQGYIVTAWSKGLSERVVVYKHALRNAMIPTVTAIGLAYGWMLAGSLLVETVFSWPGMGRYAVTSITYLDYAPVMGFVLLVALVFSISNLIVDMLYSILDPRVRYG